MPLVADFGESLAHPRGKINPYTHLKFTRDYRIFEQLSNFPDSSDNPPLSIIQTSPLPDGLTIGNASEEDGVILGRDDEPGEINWVYAKELKTLRIHDNTSFINKAIKAYLDQLSDDTPVILKWG